MSRGEVPNWLHYKVHTCPLWQAGCCTKKHCFDSHAHPPLRRKPVLRSGRWNYRARLCHDWSLRGECPRGVTCSYAHGKLELVWHPEVYKTQHCPYGLDARGQCAVYGPRCCKAHHDDELRPRHATAQGGPTFLTPRLAPCSPSRSLSSTSLTSALFVFLQHYKTRPCARPQECTCEDFDYHHLLERRRAPFDAEGRLVYCAATCARLGQDPTADECCPRSSQVDRYWNCRFAHTTVELMYHPHVFRTVMCRSPSTCRFGAFCAHAHLRSELRQRGET